MSLYTKIFGDPHEKFARKWQPIIERMNAFENEMSALTREQLREKTQDFKRKIANGVALDDILPEAFASVREAAKRTLSQRHYDVQLLASIALHRGHIAEMKTGEGKTLAATLSAYLNALTGRGVHIVTVNDYLSKRDAEWMGQIFSYLGLSVGCIVHATAFRYQENTDPAADKVRDQGIKIDMNFLVPCTRREAYACDITYGTNNEFGFDYLRDNMADSKERIVQRELHYAIVDEVDSILIDEARTPLIISAPAKDATEKYHQFADMVRKLSIDRDFNVDEKRRTATLTDDGIRKVENMLGVENIYVESGISAVHHLEQALKAEYVFKNDVDYIVKDGEVVIVDEFTGRLMPGRRYSEGLHQALEAKENVKIQQESITLATITFQNYFKQYRKLSGMTGTAITEEEEFYKIYGLEVRVIPTHQPMIRKDLSDRIYKTEMGKFRAVAEEVKELQKRGQPVLVGTISIEKNEILSKLFSEQGIEHHVLNAKQHEREAQVISQAGKKGAVTIATNMAGRGVDIILGGHPYDRSVADEVRGLGGLCIIGTQRHESRRIDNQLRGRSGRQGDPGHSQFYVSMEDDLMRIFGSDRIAGIMERLGMPEDMPIENKLISKSIETAQKKVETHNFDIRKHVVEYDNVMNKQRESIYKKRRTILLFSFANPELLFDMVSENIDKEIEDFVSFHTSDERPDDWNIREIFETAKSMYGLPEEAWKSLQALHRRAMDGESVENTKKEILEFFLQSSDHAYDELLKRMREDLRFSEDMIADILRQIILRSIDALWIEHLESIDHLRAGIGLRGYGQRDPLIEYKKESFRLFHILQKSIQKQIAYGFFKTAVGLDMLPAVFSQEAMQTGRGSIETNSKSRSPSSSENLSPSSDEMNQQDTTPSSSVPKVGRNDLCPCGSGKKYKKCHGR